MFRDFELERIRWKTDLINWLGWQAGYTSYLEVATSTAGLLFSMISSDVFSSVDRIMYCLPADYDDGWPISHRTEAADSTAGFGALASAGRTFDLIFVDGRHTYEDARRDLLFALDRLNPGGTVVVHDCRPSRPEVATPNFKEGPWLGVTYLAFLDLVAERPELGYCVVDLDTGCGILRPSASSRARPRSAELDYRDWSVYLANQKELLNLVSVEQFLTDYRVRRRSVAAWSYRLFAPALESAQLLDRVARTVSPMRKRIRALRTP